MTQVREVQTTAWLATLIALAAMGAAEASAQDEPATPRHAVLVYERADAAAACLDEASLRAEVAARLGYEPFAPRAETLVRVSIDRDDEGYAARIQVARGDEAPGLRELRSAAPDCRDLDDALVFAVSMAIDPGAALAAPAAPASQAEPEPQPQAAGEPAPQPEPEPQPPAVVEEGVEEVVEEQDAPGPTWRGDAGIGITLGSAPAPAFGVVVGAELAWSVASLRLSGRADLPASAPVTGGEVEASLLVAELAGCARLGAFYACGVGAGGALRAAGIRLTNSRAVTRPYVGLGGRLGAELPLSERVALRGQVQVLGNLVRTTLYVGEEPVWRSDPVAASLAVLAAFTF